MMDFIVQAFSEVSTYGACSVLKRFGIFLGLLKLYGRFLRLLKIYGRFLGLLKIYGRFLRISKYQTFLLISNNLFKCFHS